MRRQLHILPDDTVVDAVVGYRLWEAWAIDGTVHLSSVARRGVEWPQGVPLQAECFCQRGIRPGAIPEREHRCGIYAWREPIVPRTPATLDTQPLGTLKPSVYIAGEVLLWGDVHVHARGYRAEWALPSGFYVTDGMSGRLLTIIGLASLQFGVSLVKADTAEWKREHPNEGIEAMIRVRDWLDPGMIRVAIGTHDVTRFVRSVALRPDERR